MEFGPAWVIAKWSQSYFSNEEKLRLGSSVLDVSIQKKYLFVRNTIPEFDNRSLSSKEQIPLVSPEVNKQRHQRLLHQHSGHLAQGGPVLAAG